MADAENVTQLPNRPLEVVVSNEANAVRFTPRELRMIQEATGRSFSAILTDEASDEKFTALAWLKLRRDGVALDWGDMDDVIIVIQAPESDPTSGPPSTTSRPSAPSGE